MKKNLLYAFGCLFLLAAIGLAASAAFSFRWSNESFENVPFEWDDDDDEYILSIREVNDKGLDSIVHYTVPAKSATLVFSEEHWSCFGDVVSYYNAFGKLMKKTVKGFHINVFKEEEK